MSTEHRVRAIVLNYFGHEKTGRCLHSLRREALDKLYLVDNSADDGEFAQLQETLEAFKLQVPIFDIELIRNEENLGFGRAINQIVARDQGDTPSANAYLLLNNDTFVAQGLVSSLVSALHKDPRIALVSPRIVAENVTSCGHWYQRWVGHVSEKPVPFSFHYLTGCCLLVSDCLVEQDRIFDEDFFMYGEDLWLNWHAAQKGYRTVCVELTSVQHEAGGSSSKGHFFYEYHVARAHILLARKIAKSSWELPLLLAGRMVYLSSRASVRSLRYRSLTPLLALFRAWIQGI